MKFKIFLLYLLVFTIAISSATTFCFAADEVIPTEKIVNFSDVAPNSWPYDYISNMTALGFIKGYPDDSFKPNNNISYGEFLTLMYRVLGIEVKEYSNGNATHWAYSAAKKAQFHFIEITLDKAYLNAPILRKEAIKYSLYTAGLTHPISSEHFIHPFTDINSPSSEKYKDWIVNAYALGIIEGNPGGFANPDGKLTRAEACKILYNLYILYNQSIANNKKGICSPTPPILNRVEYELIGENSFSHLSSLANVLSYFPEEVIDQFNSDGGKIIITNESQSKYVSENKAALGCYFPSTKLIIIFTQGKANSLFFNINYALCHELGHYVWYELMSPADKTLIESSFNSPELNFMISQMKRSYGSESVTEYAAELIAFYATPINNQIITETGSDELVSVLDKYLRISG